IKPAAKRCPVIISAVAPTVSKNPNQVIALGVIGVLDKSHTTGSVKR
ncbi:unnamed protein product, partial [marine sediment metagenome]